MLTQGRIKLQNETFAGEHGAPWVLIFRVPIFRFFVVLLGWSEGPDAAGTDSPPPHKTGVGPDQLPNQVPCPDPVTHLT